MPSLSPRVLVTFSSQPKNSSGKKLKSSLNTIVGGNSLQVMYLTNESRNVLFLKLIRFFLMFPLVLYQRRIAVVSNSG